MVGDLGAVHRVLLSVPHDVVQVREVVVQVNSLIAVSSVSPSSQF